MAAVYYTGVGETLGTWAVDVDGADLAQRSSVTLPAPAMYGWPSDDRRFLYMTCSDGGPGKAGTRHFATVWRIGAGGDLGPHGEPVALHARPIHASLDRAGRHLLVAYNNPSGFTVHRIEPDGRIGSPVPQARDQFGIYGHQILTTPGDKGALLVCRGNEPTKSKPEDPGSLHTFAYADGRLTHRRAVAPNDGYGFGPRHLDFHPSEPWVLASVERQARLKVYRLLDDGDLDPAPVCDVSTLAQPEAKSQHQPSGFIKLHPSGRFAYISNRTFGREVDGWRHTIGGEQTIAVFAIDAATGQATPLQHADAGSFHLRNAGIDPSGRLLIATSIEPAVMLDGTVLPAALAVMRIGADGRLALAKRIEVDVGDRLLFWSGLVDLP
jgi:6-phosphogluconolactonase (cycloisomerase 2 family)